MDYHKPSDDEDKINYDGILRIAAYVQGLVSATDNTPKLAFTKTREVHTGRSSFKVSLGIMPDYTFTVIRNLGRCQSIFSLAARD